MKNFAIFFIIIFTSIASAKMDNYVRKSVSLFKVDKRTGKEPETSRDNSFNLLRTLGLMPDSIEEKEDLEAYLDIIYKVLFDEINKVGRFDYNPIPAAVSDPEELFSIVKKYAATKIEKRAERQWDIKNEYYGSNFVTGENVDKIISGTYIIFPTLDTFTLRYLKGWEAVFQLTLKIYSAENTGTSENPIWKPKLVKTIEGFSTGGGSGADYPGEKGSRITLKNSNPKREAVKNGSYFMFSRLEKELRKIDAFKLKGLVTKAEPDRDLISFNLGENYGVNLDDAYNVGYYQKINGKKEFIETGYMKVRKVGEKESSAQLLIVSNLGEERESDLFNEYDQVIEFPLLNNNFQLGLGLLSFKAPKGYDSENNSYEEETTSLVMNLRFEQNFAQTFKISEFYIGLSIGYLSSEAKFQLPNGDVSEMGFNNLIVEPGFRKKFSYRRLSPYVGVDVGLQILFLGDENNLIYSSGGITPNLGLSILLFKTVYLDLNGGWRIYSKLGCSDDDENKNVSIIKNILNENDWLNPSGWHIKVGIGFVF